MLDVLLASGSRHHITPKSVLTSILAHAAVVLLALAATRGAVEALKPPGRRDTMPLFLPPSPEPPSEPSITHRIPVGPPPERFRHLPLPIDLPIIQPTDFSRRPLNPRELVYIGHAAGTDRQSVNEVAGTGGIYDAGSRLEGFQPAVLLNQPAPRYPSALLRAGITGMVLLEFVIDTAGKVEPSSIHTIESSHPGFEDAARGAVLGARFQPAWLGQRAVRQKSRQQVRFMVTN
jgi:TonB family protein